MTSKKIMEISQPPLMKTRKKINKYYWPRRHAWVTSHERGPHKESNLDSDSPPRTQINAPPAWLPDTSHLLGKIAWRYFPMIFHYHQRRKKKYIYIYRFWKYLYSVPLVSPTNGDGVDFCTAGEEDRQTCTDIFEFYVTQTIYSVLGCGCKF